MSNVQEVSSVISAGVQVAGLLGGAIAFLWGRMEWSNAKIRRALQQCQRRETEAREREQAILSASKERRAHLTTIIELLWYEVSRLAPEALVLKRAKKLLDDVKKADDDGE